MTKRKEWSRHGGWSLKQDATVEDAVSALAETIEKLAAQVAALADQVEAVDVRLGELEEAGGEGAEKRKSVKTGRDVLGRRRTGSSVTRRVAKAKAPEPGFSLVPAIARARFPGTTPAVVGAAMRGATSAVEHDPNRDVFGRWRPGRGIPERDQRGRVVRR